jgi:hypothetical protein
MIKVTATYSVPETAALAVERPIRHQGQKPTVLIHPFTQTQEVVMVRRVRTVTICVGKWAGAMSVWRVKYWVREVRPVEL